MVSEGKPVPNVFVAGARETAVIDVMSVFVGYSQIRLNLPHKEIYQ